MKVEPDSDSQTHHTNASATRSTPSLTVTDGQKPGPSRLSDNETSTPPLSNVNDRNVTKRNRRQHHSTNEEDSQRPDNEWYEVNSQNLFHSKIYYAKYI